MRDYFVFGDTDSRDYDCYIFGAKVYDSPEKTVEYIDVPGRHGSIITGQYKFQNIDVAYPVIIVDDAITNLNSLRSVLAKESSYVRLTDTINPDEYRMASFSSRIEPSVTNLKDKTKFTITFNCKPQRYLLSGDMAQSVVSGGSLTNPTPFDSRPLIRIYGYGRIYIGTQRITVEDVFPYIDIDSDLMDCYYGIENANGAVEFQSNDFPVLPSGETGITYDGTITRVDVTPRWWRI